VHINNAVYYRKLSSAGSVTIFPVTVATPPKTSVWRLIVCWDCGFESRSRVDICRLYVLWVVQVEVFENDRPLVQSSPTDCVCVCVSVWAVRCSNDPLHLQWGGRRDMTTKSNKPSAYLTCTLQLNVNSLLTKTRRLVWHFLFLSQLPQTYRFHCSSFYFFIPLVCWIGNWDKFTFCKE
jgi:hypothetical protein